MNLNRASIPQPLQSGPDPIKRLAIKGFWDGLEAPDCQVGAHFEVLDKGVLVAALKSTGYFFPISIALEVRCQIMISALEFF